MIHVLEKHIADKIAAGEVIDRPVSIIKELLENSIDAGADQITVEIRNGGKSYIRVTDNGSGIEAGDMETAFLRHQQRPGSGRHRHPGLSRGSTGKHLCCGTGGTHQQNG